MSYLLVGLSISIALIVLGFIQEYIEGDGDALKTIGAVLTIVFAFIVVIWGFCLKEADTKAQMLNKTYGTNYTTEDLLYAEDVIEEIHLMNRMRLEILGGEE